MNRSYTPFIDWLKCLGIMAILYGHLVGWGVFAAFPPIYSKQLGVALFLFASGYSLSAETRDRWQVAFNRVFEIYLFGVPCALLVSLVTFVWSGRLQASNYLPFLGGANVLFNNFPANPSTWYLGTYVQIVLLWAVLLRRIRVTPGLLALSMLGEIVVRTMLMETAGRFIAYMLVPNWATVFLLGCWYEQRRKRHGWGVPSAGQRGWFQSGGWALISLVSLAVGWTMISRLIPFEQAFPFMRLAWGGVLGGELLVAAMVSTVYVAVTLLVYHSVAPLPAPWPVRFVARNTLIIFLAHMPLLYAMESHVSHWPVMQIVRSGVYVVVCLPGLALVSEGLHRVIRPRELRDRVYQHLVRLSASYTRRLVARPSSDVPV